MKKVFTLLIINIVLALLQSAFFPVLFGKSAYINWVLILGFTWLLVDAPVTAFKSVFMGGLLLDILSGNYLGFSSLIFTIGLFLMNLIRKYFFKGSASHLIFGTLLSYIYILIAVWQKYEFNFKLVSISFITACLAVLMSLLFRQILVSKR